MGKEVMLGLYLYPVLQSADILLYKAADIPVGEDNLQNIQIAQHLAQKFNYTYGNFFPRPKAVLPDNNNARVRSLRNPDKKMSKSDPDEKSCIYIDDPPGVANLILIYASLNNISPEEVIQQSINKVKLKEMVTESLVEHLAPIRSEMSRLMADEQFLDSILLTGETSAREIAEKTIKDVKKLVGFI